MTKTPLEEDRPWLDAFRAGQRGALERVFFAYANDVARQVRAARVTGHDVESVVHDAFARAFAEKARQSYDGLRPFGAWLSTITRNLITDRHRQERRMDPRSLDDLPQLIDDAPSPAARFDEAELAQVLESFAAGLDADDAALFRLRFRQRLPHPKAAAALGWSEIRVRKQDTALRVRLLTALRAAGFCKDAAVTIGTSLLKGTLSTASQAGNAAAEGT